MPNLAFRGQDGEVYVTLAGKTDSASPLFEILSRERAQIRSPGKLSGTRP